MPSQPSSSAASRPRVRKRKSRSRGLRTKTGCITCRTRHLKCDERKPQCLQCLRGNRSCEYNIPDSLASVSGNEDSGRTSAVEEDDETVEAQAPRPPADAEVVATNGESMSAHLAALRTDEGPTHNLVLNAGSVQGESPHSNGYNPYSSPHNWSLLSIPSEGGMVDEATAKWFDLLVGDASLDLFNATAPFAESSYGGDSGLGEEERAGQASDDNQVPSAPTSAFPDSGMWRLSTSLELQPYEVTVFENFVHNISSWIDLMDPYRHFSILVPRLAMRNVGLLNAILALSARHMSLGMHSQDGVGQTRSDAIQYYHSTLHYVQKAMQFDSYNTSDELLATALIVSAYEMLDGSRRDWERHLQGVFWIQRSQVIHGDSGGLRAAIWWAWLSQDCLAAWRERRKPFTFWRPERTSFKNMNAWELAARSLFLFARVIGYCADKGGEDPRESIQTKMQQAVALSSMLDDWLQHLTIEFEPIPHRQADMGAFKTILIHPPAFGAAMQVHYASRILLSLSRPLVGGMGMFMEQQTLLSKYVDQICGIAKGLTDTASSILSSQCLAIAGTCTQDTQRREEIVALIKLCHSRTGWPIKPLDEELRELWDPNAQS